MSKRWNEYCFPYKSWHEEATYRCVGGRSLFGRLEVVLLHVDVRYDIIVTVSVFSGSEVPRLVLRVVIALFQALQLVVEVKHVVGLLVPKSAVLVRGKHVNHVLLLGLLNRCLGGGIRVHLRYRVVECFLLFDELLSNFVVPRSFALKVSFLLNVVLYVCTPLRESVWHLAVLRKLANICN